MSVEKSTKTSNSMNSSDFQKIPIPVDVESLGLMAGAAPCGPDWSLRKRPSPHPILVLTPPPLVREERSMESLYAFCLSLSSFFLSLF